MAYRPTDKFKRDVINAVRRFNRTIDRLSRMYQSSDAPPIIPEKRSVRDILKSVESYDELRREVRSMNRFRNGKPMDVVNFQGQNMTRWQAQQIRYDIKTANAKREEIRNMIGYQEVKRPVDTENLGERHLVDLTGLDKATVNEYINSLHKETTFSGQYERLALMKENYKKSFRSNFDSDQISLLYEYVDQLSDEEFARYYVNNELEDVNYIYGPIDAAVRYNDTRDKLKAAVEDARAIRLANTGSEELP